MKANRKHLGSVLLNGGWIATGLLHQIVEIKH